MFSKCSQSTTKTQKQDQLSAVFIVDVEIIEQLLHCVIDFFANVSTERRI